jgi:aspartate aminotransferase
MSLYGKIPEGVPDGAFAMIEAFKKDTDERKVNLSPGIYCDDNAKTWVLPAVKKVKSAVHPLQSTLPPGAGTQRCLENNRT